MSSVLCPLFVLLGASFFGFFVRNPSHKRKLVCAGVLTASVWGSLAPLRILTGKTMPLEVILPGGLPGLTLAFGIDRLSAFFLVAIFVLSFMVALTVWEYLKEEKRLLATLPFFPLLVAAMAAVVCARDGFLFLICWEVMSLASFFLVTTEHENREVRHAGWIYLMATHLATAFLMAFFVLLSCDSGSFLFSGFLSHGPIPPVLSGILFVFAVIGFGTKAGIFPLHVWLPHAHPAAPSYVSALMSAVMIKTGIYGILRALTFLPEPPLWWGGGLMILGFLSAFMGILNGAVSQDFKRLLAYSSVENVGIIFIGLGLGVLGLGAHEPELVFLGFGGALFHLGNHALFKGALFLLAGQILHAAHSRMIDELGGLFKKMPLLGILVLILSVAISGLPPLNGFMSEALIYFGLFRGVQTTHGFSLFVSAGALVGLAFAGALTVMTFTKLFGVIFLGEPRTEKALKISAERFSLTLGAPLILTALCGGMVLFAMPVWSVLQTVVMEIAPSYQAREMPGPANLLVNLVQLFFIFSAAAFFLWLAYRMLWGRRPARPVVTWDCGYVSPAPRMQYTGSSFTEPPAVFFQDLLKPVTDFKRIADFFPRGRLFAQQIGDVAERHVFLRLFQKIDDGFARIRHLQKGKIQSSLALIFEMLIALLLWEVWIGI